MERTVRIGLAITATCILGGCQNDDPYAEDAAPRKAEPAKATPDRAVPPTKVVAEAPLGDHVTQVKLPAVTDGKATKFRFGKENEHEAWIANLPEHDQLVTIAYNNGRLFVGGGFSSSTMYALDASTGKQLWSAQELADPGPTAVVAEDDDVAFNTFSCSMVVLDAKTGKQRWSKWTGSETPNQPAIYKNLVIAPHPSDEGYSLSAYTRKSGHEVWSSPIDNHILTTPIVHGDSVYVSTTSGTLYRVTTEGKRVWSKSINAASAPWIDGDTVHLAVREGGQEVQVELAASDGHRLRTFAKAKSPGDVPEDAGTGVWAFEGARPVVVGGVRYAAMPSSVEARDVRTGEVIWTRESPKADTTRKVNSVVVAGSLVMVATRDGQVLALDKATGSQRMAFSFGTPITAQPVVANGWMYISTARGQVLAFDLGSKAIDGWHMWGGNAQHNL
jgi:outer membrane protein assembly factor BamB